MFYIFICLPVFSHKCTYFLIADKTMNITTQKANHHINASTYIGVCCGSYPCNKAAYIIASSITTHTRFWLLKHSKQLCTFTNVSSSADVYVWKIRGAEKSFICGQTRPANPCQNKMSGPACVFIFPICHIIEFVNVEPVCVHFYQCQPVYVDEIYSACPVLLHYCGAFQEWGISKQFMTDTFIGPYKKRGAKMDHLSLFPVRLSYGLGMAH